MVNVNIGDTIDTSPGNITKMTKNDIPIGISISSKKGDIHVISVGSNVTLKNSEIEYLNIGEHKDICRLCGTEINNTRLCMRCGHDQKEELNEIEQEIVNIAFNDDEWYITSIIKDILSIAFVPLILFIFGIIIFIIYSL